MRKYHNCNHVHCKTITFSRSVKVILWYCHHPPPPPPSWQSSYLLTFLDNSSYHCPVNYFEVCTIRIYHVRVENIKTKTYVIKSRFRSRSPSRRTRPRVHSTLCKMFQEVWPLHKNKTFGAICNTLAPLSMTKVLKLYWS